MKAKTLILLVCLFTTGYWSYASFPVQTDNAKIIQSAGKGNTNLIVGFRGGVNFSQPYIMNRNEVIQGYDPASLPEKKYSGLFSNIGYQYAFMIMAYLKENLSLSFEPGMSTYIYKYKTLMGWTNGTDATDYFEFSGRHRNKVTYVEFPVVLRYEFEGGAFTPFVSLGAFYGIRTNASKLLESSVTRHTGTVSIPYETSSVTSDNTETYIQSRFGITPGIGLFYSIGAAKLMLSADYGFGLNNIVNESQRYSNSPVTSGMYDVQDDMRLGALNINIGILFNTGKNQAGKSVECITFKRSKQ